MIKVNIGDAKTQFSKYKNAALAGKKVVICERNVPILELKTIAKNAKRKLGLYDGMYTLSEDFNDIPTTEEIDQFYTSLNI